MGLEFACVSFCGMKKLEYNLKPNRYSEVFEVDDDIDKPEIVERYNKWVYWNNVGGWHLYDEDGED